ncbi:MAG: hypothetical protein ACFCUS_03615 [Rubrimonas sp.]
MANAKNRCPSLRHRVTPLGFSILLLTSGCASGIRGEPESSLDPNRDVLVQAVKLTLSDESIRSALSTAATARQRNEIVFARFAEIDRLYFEYEIALSREARESGFIVSLAALGAGIGGTLASAASASQAFSAASAAIAGVNAAYNEQVLLERTIQALTSQMRAGRDAQKKVILLQLSKQIGDYPLLAALTDLEAYRQAGTLSGAILGITETATAAEQVARLNLVGAQETLRLGVERIRESERPSDLTIEQRKDRLAVAIRSADAAPDNRILQLANNPPGRTPAFDQRLAPFAAGGPITDARVARVALEAAIRAYGAADLSAIAAWENALRIN